ncbi:MAG: hypothetical protein A3D59_00065 [Candidatus Wildermuthbacteria bacterium RIFCSPHIGHO2_02_FULL_47_17]|uniref:LamG-like jellyroll fold domain-containing protein n=1 Tax=Candidatus Wildermuthbacteria bacterium RIFCSPHIGHO2_02_FULL_47_17 TaxID=1802452 RepID=A0A1G2R1U1_9BACT|nr:MAG: hypothetical protein A3D59_00065 [Candidatus Wildermuthbacteria bacterium RIFCSPHIGHO2_02_FULL_47_17]
MDSLADQGTRIEDVNGDGLNDLIRNATTSSPNGVYLNTGKGWSFDSSWTIPLPTVGFDGQKDIGTRLLDFDGDGLLDMVRRRSGESNEVYLRNGRRPDLVATTTNPRGGKIGIGYQASPQYRAGSAVANPNLPINLDTVKTLTYDDRIGSTTQRNFSYDGGQYYTGNIRDRRFTGFATTTETDALGFVTKRFFHQGSTTQSTIGEYQDHISKIGKSYRTEVYDEASNIYQKTISKWDRSDRGDGASFIFLSEMLDITHDGDASTKSKAEGFGYNTASGTITQKIEYGEVTGSNDGTFSDTGTDKLTTGYQYATSTATSTILALSQEQTLDQSSNKVRERKIYYDTLSQGFLNKANPTKEEFWVSGSTYIDTEKSYNSFGLVFQEKDPRDNTTTYVYDAAKLYPATTTNPAGHVIERTYDYSSSKPTSITDSNGNIFETTYDGLDRVTEEKQPDLTSTTTLVTKTTYQYTDTGLPTRVLKTDYLNSATTSESYMYFDGFGRKIQERIETEDAGVYSAKNTRYDERGLVKTESLPYFSNSTSYTGTSSPPASNLLTTFTYDPRDRVEKIDNSVGSTTYTYSDWVVTIRDPNNNRKDLTNDAFGNLITVTEYSPGATSTQYQYDGNRRLTRLTDSLTNVRNFTYDGLGRRLTAEDLHVSGDGIYGTTTYVYDAAGNLATTTDAKSQTVNYIYDSLNRVLTEDYAGAAGTEVSYTYDTCASGKGKLCFTAASNASASLSYNAIGGVAAEAKNIGGTQYASTTFAYDRQGNQTQVTYPDGREVAYTYDSAGKLADVKTRASGGAWATILSDIDYAAHGAPSLYVYGNGISIPRTYDDTKLYRLTRIGDSNSSAVQDIHYTYDAVGNITQITDGSLSGGGKTVLFTYDTLNRLTSASTTAASSTPYYEGYVYNPIGNLLFKGPEVVSTTSVSNTHSLDLESGSSQYASIADASQVSLDFTDELTLSAWIKIESFAGGTLIRKSRGDDSQRSYASSMDSSNVYVAFSSDGSNNETETFSWSPSTGVWYHLAFTHSGSTVKFYLNGTQQGGDQTTSMGTLFNSNRPFAIGASHDSAGNPEGLFDGLVDDARVWSKALSSSDISDLYTSHDPTNNASDLEGFWKFDGGYTDASGNANTLTAYNSPTFSTDIAFPAGTIITTSTTTTYTYATTSAGYANPHAVTQISPPTFSATTTLVYDNNGNLTQSGAVSGTTTYAWDYRNRLIGSATSTQTGTTTYAYDHADQRVRKVFGGTTNTYINKFYDLTTSTAISSASTTAYIWVGDMLVATVEGNGYATSTYFVHPDHLGSTNVITNSAGVVTQAIDYYPFGEERLNTNANLADRTFINQFYDREQSLSYLNARYLQSSRGQFLSQDAVFWSQEQNLSDPQSLNSYSYANNNPINRSDPSGRASIASTLSAISSILSKISTILTSLLSLSFGGGNRSGGIGASSGGSSAVQPTVTNKSNPNALLVKTTTWDPVTDARIRGLDPRVQKPAADFINNTERKFGTQLRIMQGSRSIEEQNKLYAQGRTTPGNVVTNARGGESYHNYGRAIDVVRMNSGQSDWASPISSEIAAIGKAEDFAWGGDWSAPYTDYPHFEMTFGESVQSLQQRR